MLAPHLVFEIVVCFPRQRICQVSLKAQVTLIINPPYAHQIGNHFSCKYQTCIPAFSLFLLLTWKDYCLVLAFYFPVSPLEIALNIYIYTHICLHIIYSFLAVLVFGAACGPFSVTAGRAALLWCSGFSLQSAESRPNQLQWLCRAGSRMCDCQDFLFSVQIVMKLELLEDIALWGPFSDSHELEVSGMTENGELEGRT